MITNHITEKKGQIIWRPPSLNELNLALYLKDTELTQLYIKFWPNEHEANGPD